MSIHKPLVTIEITMTTWDSTRIGSNFLCTNLDPVAPVGIIIVLQGQHLSSNLTGASQLTAPLTFPDSS